MGAFMLVDGLFYLIGGGVFAALGWLINHAAGALRSSGLRALIAAVTSLLPLLLPIALGLGPALLYGPSADPKLPLLALKVTPLLLPAALGSLLGARRPASAPSLP